MAEARSSQEPVQILSTNAPSTVVSQEPVQVMGNLKALNTLVSQLPVQILVSRTTEQPRMWITS